MSKKTVVIVLGNRLNDDGSITKIQEERLKMALELEEMFHPDYFILSGGLANPIPQLTEAEAMYNYLVKIDRYSSVFNEEIIELFEKN